MRISINTSKWYDRPWAALIFFTRLPFWRLHQPRKEAYESVVEYWPLAGWLTGGLTATVIWAGTAVFPFYIALILALISRVILTGALHEDGLADLFDGLGGGGSDRHRILTIMKDSHIGTYGVLALVAYAALLFAALYALGPFYAALAVLGADPFAKMTAGLLTQLLPYARSEEQSKAQILYRRFSPWAGCLLLLQAILPLFPLVYMVIFHPADPLLRWDVLLAAPCVVLFSLYVLLARRLKGYTGDCCGAAFLLVELSIYLGLVIQLTR